MTSVKRSKHQGFVHLRQRLQQLGVDSDSVLDALLERINIPPGRYRSEDIIVPGKESRHSTVLIEGVACMYERLSNGSRQIFSFQYSGDFCDLARNVLPVTNNEVAVAAITPCSVGTIGHNDLNRLIAQYPALGLALWRAAMIEASILRKRLLSIGRQPALQRVAYLICEQLARQDAVGIESACIPLSQLDVADAAGLSTVHVNRTFKELLRRGLLVRMGRTMKVADRAGLASLGEFDGKYLNMPRLLSRWQLDIQLPSQLIKS